MPTTELTSDIIGRGRASTSEALALFDALDPVDLNFMTGDWQGSGIHTGHPMDGLLETYAWHGKTFVSPDEVHPLIFEDGRGRLFAVNAALMPMGLALRMPALKWKIMRPVFRLGKFLLGTKKSGARLRMLEHRGKFSATMIYDAQPINDVFRRLDENTVLGLMDLKGCPQPFFFLLRRK